MPLTEFWRSTPRLTSLFVEGYSRRRAWAAFYAGFGSNAKDAKIEHLLGRKPQGEAMEPDKILSVVRRIKKNLEKRWANGE